MRIAVQKYGGSSVADVERIKAVAKRVVATRDQGYDVVVVVSAMGKSTDQLIALAKQITDAPSRRELDMLMSCGERTAMALVAMAIQAAGRDAISLTGSQAGIMTNDRHSGARILEVRPFRVEDELERGQVVVVAGFQGMSYKREVTTLGRGGSDTTAVALAGALKAEYCEICSDVVGVYTADPRIVAAAELLEAISHDQMLELASHGAKVLHAESVEFARRSGIAIYARASFIAGEGTRIDRSEAISHAPEVAGVTSQRGLVRLRARVEHSMDRLLGVAAESSLPVLHLDADHEIADLWFSPADVPDWPKVRQLLIGQVEIEEPCAAVSVVGEFFGRNAARLAQVRSVASGIGVAVKAMATSPLRATLFCADADADRLVQALHRVLRGA